MKLYLFVILFFISGFFNFMKSQHNYKKALHLSTRYLGAQRSGDTKSWILPEGSGGAFLQDGEAVGVDLSGGWHDCGDYIKFHVTGPYAALLYLYGYDKWPDAYPDNYSQDYSKPPPNGIPDVLDEVKIQTDYLINCVGDGVIYWQVGDSRDHNGFNEPISQSQLELYNNSSVRPVYEATEGHSNAFGSAAAALALMSILYEPYDEDYAQECLEAAVAYYETGNINPSTTADARNESYSWLTQWSDYYDEMGAGAVMLYRATNDESYLDHAKAFAENASEYRNFSYGNIDHLLFYELHEITGEVSYLNKIAYRVNYNIQELQPCGYIHLTNWGSLRDAGNAALLASLYHNITGDEDAYEFAKRNIDFILGSHDGVGPHEGVGDDIPPGYSFLIGYNELGAGYPQSPHHAAAFGKSSNAWSDFNQESNNPGSAGYTYELTGALAGGPERECTRFTDNISNYVSNEYCIYYNAAFNSALAYIQLIESNKPELTIEGSFSVEDKVYDGTKQATILSNDLTLKGLVYGLGEVFIANEDIVVEFEDSNASENEVTVSLISAGISGPDANQYKLSLSNKPSTQAKIFLKEVKFTGIEAQDKPYDATTIATINIENLVGVIEGEDVEIDEYIGNFVDPNVAEDIEVVVEATIKGTDTGNYTFTQPTGITANITAAELTIGGTFTVFNKQYDGNTNAEIDDNSLTLLGILNNEDVSIIDVVTEFESAEIGEDHHVTIVSAGIEGLNAGNYALSLTGAPFAIADIISPTNIYEVMYDKFIIYPNPFDGYIYLENTYNISNITITNIVGQIVRETKIKGISKINTKSLKNGVYLVTIEFNDGKKKTIKMLK